ncbi:hypothetical protein GCM10009786_00540 [Leucobacter alluvii]|uniref:Uncharacterized protein n=1 Tax=Leucobacter alluvii TaxID=340321 RepID=A0ABN3B118_9MICO
MQLKHDERTARDHLWERSVVRLAARYPMEMAWQGPPGTMLGALVVVRRGVR